MNHQLDLFVNVNISGMWRTIQFRVNQEKERAGQDKIMAANNDNTDLTLPIPAWGNGVSLGAIGSVFSGIQCIIFLIFIKQKQD